MTGLIMGVMHEAGVSVVNKIPAGILAAALLFSACSKKSTDNNNGLSPSPPADTVSEDTAYVLPQVDNAVLAFMTRYNVPGLSVAITKDGKLVYVKGYGYADKVAQTGVSDSSLFRIASLSKIFTSVTIMKLREEGKLKLSDKIFGKGAILGTQYGTQPYGKYVTAITVNNLLHHTGGGWGNSSNDPMFSNPDLTADQLISWTLDNQPLTHAPGTFYDYSNFGYCILGRVIEKLTGMPYDVYVKDSVLEPIGIADMQIGGNTRSERKPDEVVYYQQNYADPYGMNVTRMDSHGGWIATATDMVRFLVHIDGFDNPPDILNTESIQLLTKPSQANQNYACGISVNNAHNWWHTGALPGTATEFVRTHHGYCWAILMNTQSYQANFWSDLDNLIWIAVNDPATQWRM